MKRRARDVEAVIGRRLTDRVERAVAWLLNESHLMRPEHLPLLVDQAARGMGASGCRIYLIARDQRDLVPLSVLSHTGRGPDTDALNLDGTVAGRSYRNTEVVVSSGDPERVWVPLLDGTERLGVLEIVAGQAGDATALREACLPFAALVAELVVSKGQYTDTFERARRALPMGVPSEMLWRLLPPLTFATDRFVVTAQLEPWNEVGGDAFDYSISGDVLRFAVFDGMGHGLSATLLASVAVAAYRNARRVDLDLIQTASSIDAVLSRQFGSESFVTAVLAELDLTTGVLRALSAAHPPPLLVRSGRSLGQLDVPPGLPLGFGERADVVVTASLEPSDRLLMFSDGVVEARSAEGEFFGIERLEELLLREEAHRQPPPETLRRLILAVLDHQQDKLQDDATLLMLEWGGDSGAVLMS